MTRAANVVYLARPRCLNIVPESADQIVTVDIVTHLLTSIAKHRVGFALHYASGEVGKETVKLVIRRRFSGDLLEADGKAECRLLEEGVYSVNKRNELLWIVTLEPGGETTLRYRYTVLVDN